MTNPLVTINIVVFNGEKYIRHCLKAVSKQSYSNIEINIFDNNSNDRTRDIAALEFPAFNLVKHHKNLGMWPGQEKALEYSHGEYIIALSVDVILDKNFIQEAVEAFDRHPKAGALQAKVYQYNLKDIDQGIQPVPVMIDTCGFQLSRSRRVKNIGHGEIDRNQFGQEKEIFGVEGAVPVFRKDAFENCRVQGHIADPDFFWYGDDLDLAWRLRLFGWEEWYIPELVAYHDRSTTKGHSKNLKDYLARIEGRRRISVQKRRLDWSNVRFTIIKNDYIINILRDLPQIIVREIAVGIYTLLFEPSAFAEIFRFFRLIPRMLVRRKAIMNRAVATPESIHLWMRQAQ